MSGIRPVRGFPEASRIGDSLRLDGVVTHVEFSPKHDYALAAFEGKRSLMLVDLKTDEISLTAIGARASDQIALSPSGGAAVLVYKSRHRLSVMTGLPESPRMM